MKRAKKDHAEYLKTGEVTDDLLESVWRLAYLDAFYRVPLPPTMLLERKEIRLGAGAAELRGLLRLAPVRSWKPRELLALNPTFGDASLLVGGADADVIVDDTIIDIKTSTDAGAPREAFNQLIGYAALAELGGVNGKPRRIRHLELYMARYGTTYRYDREDVIDEGRWPLFVEWFVERAMEENPITSHLAPALSIPLSPSGLSGSFGSSVNYSVGNRPESVAVGDFNGDGSPDLAVANCVSRGTVSVLLGNGDGSFGTPKAYRVGASPRAVAVGDFNGDGYPDLAVANSGSGTLSVLLGNGDGTFQAQKVYAVGNGPVSVAVGDFNSNGVLDLAVANSHGTVSVLLGKGDGSFQRQRNYRAGIGPVSVAVGDFNGDGNLDLAVANKGGDTVSVLLGTGDGSFRPRTTYIVGSAPGAVAVGDFNGDGVLVSRDI